MENSNLRSSVANNGMASSGGAGAGSGEERRYVHLSPDMVTNVAESLGINNLAAGVAKELSEDVTYRLREIADMCSQFLRHSRKRKLTTDMVNKTFKCKNIEPVIGHKKSRILGCDSFEYLPEGDIFIESDREINLVNESLQNDLPIPEAQISVSASWITLQGYSLSGHQDGKVNPTQPALSPLLQQYYATVTGHILGGSDQICQKTIHDLRQNPRLTPLLPYLVTFARICLSRHKEHIIISSRIIRLISALFSNPHINLTPKPYLSYLVSALLCFLIKESKDNNPVDNVQLAACVLSQALMRWATPTNQLRAQTLKALRENCGNELSYSQYGSIVSLSILGPEVVQECVLPQLENLIGSLHRLLNQHQREFRTRPQHFQLGATSFGLLLHAGARLLRHWLQAKTCDFSASKKLYSLLVFHYGDAIVPFLLTRPERSVTGLNVGKEKGKLKIRRIGRIGGGGGTITKSGAPGTSRPEAGGAAAADLFGESRNFDRGFLSSQENFNILADMGVPSDIFETGDMEAVDKSVDFSGYFKPRTVNLSKSVQAAFMEARPFKFKAKAIKLSLGPCKQVEPDRYSQKKTLVGCGKRMVSWRNLVVGSRVGSSTRNLNSNLLSANNTQSTKRQWRIFNYTDIMSYPL